MVEIIMQIATTFIIVGMLLAFWRFLKGPHLVDRVLSFDVMTVSSIGLMALIALFAGRSIYMDVAMVYGLLSFTGVIVIARYLEKGF